VKRSVPSPPQSGMGRAWPARHSGVGVEQASPPSLGHRSCGHHRVAVAVSGAAEHLGVADGSGGVCPTGPGVSPGAAQPRFRDTWPRGANPEASAVRAP
jgi:hypothetical protein